MKQTRKYIGNTIAALAMAIAISGAFSSQARAETYVLDAGHSNVGFEVAHLMISTVEGKFKNFSGSFTYDREKQTVSNIKVSIQSASIETNEADRDKHLRSQDFFDVENHPKLTFVGTGKTKLVKGKALIPGKLTIRGVTKQVVLDTNLGGIAKDPWGNVVLAFSAQVQNGISRKEFGLTWNKALEAGGILVGDNIEIFIRGEANPAK